MNFDLGEKEKDIQTRLKKALGPEWEDLRLSGTEDSESIRIKTLGKMKAIAQTGYLQMGVDPGDQGMPLVSAQLVVAEQSPSLFLCAETSSRMLGALVREWGTSQQKDAVLPGLDTGEALGAVALSEGGMSLDERDLNTMGNLEKNEYRVTGSKDYVVNAPVADWIAVAARVGDDQKRFAFFLLPRDQAGLQVHPPQPTLGYDGVATGTLTLTGCPIPLQWVMGPFDGAEVLAQVRTREDQILTVAALGLMKRAYKEALRYAKTHVRGGKPIIAYQEVGFKLAEMLTLYQTAELLAFRSAWMAREGQRETSDLAHCAKVFCCESAETVTSQALQVLGGHGSIRGNPAEEGYRNAKYLQVAGTSTEISRMKIGDSLLA